MALTTAQIQNAYVTFFNRPADVAGLNYWSTYTGSESDLYSTFAQQTEYTSLFSGQNNTAIVNTIYTNLFGHAPDVTGLNYWVAQLDAKNLSVANAALAINKGAQGTDATAVSSKVSAATTFTTSLDTTAEITGYASPSTSSLASVKTWLAAVTDATTLATQTSATSIASITTTVANGAASNGTSFTLTTDADEIVGTTANDKINGTDATLTVFDEINGGAGTDTLNLVFSDVTGDVAGLSVTSVENVVIKAADAVGATDAPFDMTGWVDVQNVTITAAGTDAAVEVASAAANAVNVTAKGVVTLTDETAVSITVGTTGDDAEAVITAGNANVTVTTTGDAAAVTITAADAAAVAVTVAESDVTLTADSADSVSVTGSTNVTLTVDDLGAVTLKSAVDNSDTPADATDDTLVQITADVTTVANTALSLTLNGADVVLTATDADADEVTTDDDLTTLNLNVAAAALGNVLDLTSDTITDITVTGAGDLNLTVDTTVVTDIDASAATGDITVEIAGETMSYSGGAGVDTVTLTDLPIEALDEDEVGTGEFATTIDGGAGAADVLVTTALIAAGAADLVDGDDVVTDAFTNAIKGFEVLSLTEVDSEEVDATTFGIDYVKLAGTVHGFELTIANEGTVEYTTDATSSAILVDGALEAADDAEDEEAAAAAAADFSLNLVLTGGEDGIDAGDVTVANVGVLTLASNGTEVEVDDEMVVTAENAVALTADAATTLTITGNAALALTGSVLAAIETVDAADFDAGLTIDVASSDAEDGVSITVGNGNNVITGSAQDDTIVAGNGDNLITGGAGADAITIGSGVNILTYDLATDSTGLNVDVITGFNANDLDADEVDELFNVFDFTALLAGPLLDGNVTFLGSVANATLANTALVDVVGDTDENNNDLQVIYVTGEKTLCADANGNGSIDAGDLAIELVGLVGTLTQGNFDAIS